MVCAVLQKDGVEVRRFDFPSEIDRFLSEREEFDVAVPVFHGKGGEDGTVQGFLEILEIPYVFSSVEAHAIAMDKAKTKILVDSAGVQAPRGRIVRRGDVVSYDGAIVIKPMDAGSSVGVTIAHDPDAFARGLAEAFTHSESVLLEAMVRGDEYTVAVIDEGKETVALPIIQIKSKNAFFDLESKYDPELAEEICPAPISTELAHELTEAAIKAHYAVGARHLSRSDFMVSQNGEVWFLEINTIPGMTSASLLPKALNAAGKDFGMVLYGWIDSVLQN
jgi:D-alanine-D-alanine ligase